MEKIIEKYKKLFELKISHAAFKQDFNVVSDWLIIKPNPETKQLLLQNKLVFKEINTGFLVLAQTKNETEKDNEAMISVKNISLKFDLEFTNQSIASRTALPLKKNKKYLFTNSEVGITAPNLAIAPPNFDNTTKYDAGEIVKDEADFKIAVFDYSKPISDRIKFKKIAVWSQYITSQNLKTIDGIDGFGQIKIDVNTSLNNDLRVLDDSEKLVSPTFEIRVFGD